MRYLTILFISCLFCVSCANKKQDKQSLEPFGVELIKVDLREEYKERKFPNINYSMKVQRLEDNEEYPIGEVSKLIIDEKRIYILDSAKAKALFIYSREGKLLHLINQIGRGPGEFIAPQDFNIDKRNGDIVVMDAHSKKMLVYSSQGEYIREFNYGLYAVRFIIDDENNILLDNGNIPSEDSLYYLKKIDFDGKLLDQLFPSDPSTVGITFTPRAPLQRHQDILFFLPALSNCIYALDGDGAKVAYQIDFGKDWPSEEFCERMKNTHPLKIRELMFENNYICFLNYIQTRDVLHLDFYKGKRYSFYYNKMTKKSLLISMEDESFSYPLTTYGDEFVFVKYHEVTGAPTVVFYTVNFDLI